MNSGTFTIGNPTRFLCEKHGIIQSTINVTLNGRNDHYCMSCYIEWIEKNVTKVSKIEANSAKGE